ncbi:5'/3'-nucleotidase SurE [Rosistilla oblonga]|uniref:5'-nucleotidase n=1 Tax=Rosistilla oblonga TaxID=2527990 RepID=A0A518IRC5_9BACT|nr:5'/3'-nucleotidase SurE [Rosistilla oblonga]QDV55655.1 5'-nucleotidase SurE [Rosistilla oblonga]
MKVLLSNDDGIQAEGIQALKRALRRTMDVVVVAPETEQSECGHRVTTKRPLIVKQYGEAEYSVDGSPADCVRVGLLELAPETSLVISGMNHGGNVGADIWMSGTVAAAREGYLRGRCGIAVSQVRRRDIRDDWDRSARFACEAIAFAIEESKLASTLWNINLPAVDTAAIPAMQCCQTDRTVLPLNYRKTADGYQFEADYHGRPRTPEADIDVCFGGRISISLLD